MSFYASLIVSTTGGRAVLTEVPEGRVKIAHHGSPEKLKGCRKWQANLVVGNDAIVKLSPFRDE
jgi:hypothetical protein